MRKSFSSMRAMVAVFGLVFGLFAVGCSKSESSTPTTPDDTTKAVLNDDPNCVLWLRKGNTFLTNVGQVTYVKRVLTTKPSGGLNPTCVQYNDTRTGETTLWKDPSNRSERVATLPSDRGVDKIVVWYQ